MLQDIRIEFNEPIVIHCDNTSIVNMSENPVLHSKTKCISIKYHMLREKFVEKEIRLDYVSNKEKLHIFSPSLFPKILLSICEVY